MAVKATAWHLQLPSRALCRHHQRSCAAHSARPVDASVAHSWLNSLSSPLSHTLEAQT